MNELNRLTKKGFFGKDSQQSLKLQSYNTLYADYRYFISIYNFSTSVKRLHQFNILFMKLFTEGIKVNSKEVNNIIFTSITGSKMYPEFETFSSYSKFIQQIQILNKKINDFKEKQFYLNKNDLYSDEIDLMNKILSIHFDGYEYSMKLFSFILSIMKLIKHERYSIKKLYTLSSFLKLDRFCQLDNSNQYNLLYNIWDRKLRNANGHNDIKYYLEKGYYIGKTYYKFHGKKRPKYFRIYPYQIINRIFDMIYFMQGYFCAGYLLTLAKNDKKLYKKACNHMLTLVKS